jgi:hypothetical protein
MNKVQMVSRNIYANTFILNRIHRCVEGLQKGSCSDSYGRGASYSMDYGMRATKPAQLVPWPAFASNAPLPAWEQQAEE